MSEQSSLMPVATVTIGRGSDGSCQMMRLELVDAKDSFNGEDLADAIIPSGWVVVPIEPTDAEIEAAARELMYNLGGYADDDGEDYWSDRPEGIKQLWRSRARSALIAARSA